MDNITPGFIADRVEAGAEFAMARASHHDGGSDPVHAVMVVQWRIDLANGQGHDEHPLQPPDHVTVQVLGVCAASHKARNQTEMGFVIGLNTHTCARRLQADPAVVPNAVRMHTCQAPAGLDRWLQLFDHIAAADANANDDRRISGQSVSVRLMPPCFHWSHVGSTSGRKGSAHRREMRRCRHVIWRAGRPSSSH